jgi:hypothetical protein
MIWANINRLFKDISYAAMTSMTPDTTRDVSIIPRPVQRSPKIDLNRLAVSSHISSPDITRDYPIGIPRKREKQPLKNDSNKADEIKTKNDLRR